MEIIKYSPNIFFYVNDFFIFLLNPQKKLKYDFHYLNNNYYIEIKNKKNEPLNIKFKIITIDNKCYYYNINKNTNNFIKLLDFNNLLFNNKHQDSIQIDNKIINFIDAKFPDLETDLYNKNLFDMSLIDKNIIFLKYNWFYFGMNNNYQYFKYIIYKNKVLFNCLKQKIDYQLTYSINKKYSLLFIDDRYDDIFPCILTTFLYSVNNDWNLHIFTTDENSKKYTKYLTYFNIEYKIHIINKFENINTYSNLLKTNDFWKNIDEDYVLLFQYDSLAFDKFNYDNLKYNYIGAQWPQNIQQVKGIYNGNGGTSFRNVRKMQEITLKYNYILNDMNTPEDVYFAKYLYNENCLMNDPNICNEFSFENVYSETSIYGHAIYECISFGNLEEYILNRLNKLL